MGFKHISTDTSITVVVDGNTTTIQNDAPNFKTLKAAIRANDEAAVRKNLSVSGAVEAWSRENFKYDGDGVFFKGEKVPSELGERIVAMAANGDSPEPLMKFWEKLQKNPSWRSVQQLFPFLRHQGIPIIGNGNFLAYKGVNSNYTDKHSGRVDNKPGAVCEMPRNKISDDPDQACHYGFHVGALAYARDFGCTVVVCEVDPSDVVCIPHDSSQQKMRVSKYRVRGNHNGELLPSTTYDLEADLGAGAVVEPEDEELDYDVEESLETKEAKAELKELNDMFEAIENQGLVEAPPKPRAKRLPLERRLKEQRKEDKPARLRVSREFWRIHEMGRRELLDQTIQDLRDYAGRVLHIVGATKIPGGKVPLVSQILKVRRNFA